MSDMDRGLLSRSDPSFIEEIPFLSMPLVLPGGLWKVLEFEYNTKVPWNQLKNSSYPEATGEVCLFAPNPL